MKQTIAIILNITSAMIIADALGIGYKLMVFLFIGAVPFTDVVLPSSQMLALMLALMIIVIARVSYPFVKKYSLKYLAQTKLPTKRLSRV